jgi:hypothetical protein
MCPGGGGCLDAPSVLVFLKVVSQYLSLKVCPKSLGHWWKP